MSSNSLRFAFAIVLGFSLSAGALAQAPIAGANASAGNAEGPMSNGDSGPYSAVAEASDSDPEFGTAESIAGTTGPSMIARGSASAFEGPAWVANGSGDWLDEIQVPFTGSSVGGLLELAGVKFSVRMHWSLGDNGHYNFSFKNRSSGYASTQGFFFNDFNLPTGNSGTVTQDLFFPFDSVEPAEAPGVYIGHFQLSMSMAGGVGSGDFTTGTFGAGQFTTSMRAVQEMQLVMLEPSGEDPPTDGTPIDQPGPTVSASGVDYGNLVFPTADFNSDMSVDGDDFLIWQRGLGMLNAGRADGNTDPSADGDVDGADLTLWKLQYGLPAGLVEASPTVTAAATPVPEPGSAGLAVAGAAGLTACGWRRRRVGCSWRF